MRSGRIKSILLSAIAISMAIGAAACQADVNPYKEKSTTVLSDYNDHKVDMTVKVIWNRKVEVTLVNNSDKSYSYGNLYHLEYRYGNEWYQIPFDENYGFTMEAYMLGSVDGKAMIDGFEEKIANTRSFTVYLDGTGTLPEGHYRMIKDISEDGGNDYILAAEFDLAKETDEPEPLKKTEIPEDKIIGEISIASWKKVRDIEVEFLFDNYSPGPSHVQYQKDGEWYDLPIMGESGTWSSTPSDENDIFLIFESPLASGTYRLLCERVDEESGNITGYDSFIFEIK